MAIDRRMFLQVTTAVLAASGDAVRTAFANVDPVTPPTPILKLESDPHRASIPFLSWDTEGVNRVQRNLLRTGPGITLRLKSGDSWREAVDLPARQHKLSGNGTQYHLSVSPQEELIWNIKPGHGGLTLSFTRRLQGKSGAESLELLFPFNPRVTPITAIPSDWREDGTLQLPAVISAPDFGQMILDSTSQASVEVRLEGSRANHTVDLVLRFSPPGTNETFTVTLTPLNLAPPVGLKDAEMWKAARRGWCNLWQPSSRWGEQNRPFSAPAGVLSNNVISDPASCSLWFYADPILWTPEIAPGISAARLVRRSVDWWLDKRTRPSGEVICYWDYGNFLDANAGVVIAAWDYVEATGDLAWLRQRIERFEFVSDFLARRDVDGDGMVEPRRVAIGARRFGPPAHAVGLMRSTAATRTVTPTPSSIGRGVVWQTWKQSLEEMTKKLITLPSPTA